MERPNPYLQALTEEEINRLSLQDLSDTCLYDEVIRAIIRRKLLEQQKELDGLAKGNK